MIDLLGGNLCPQNMRTPECPALDSLLSLLTKIPAVVWLTDLDSRFTSISGLEFQQLNLDSKEFIGASIESLFSCTSPYQDSLAAHHKAIQGQHSAFSTEIKGRLLDGHVEPLRGLGGVITGVIGLAFDTTAGLVIDRAIRLSERNYRSFVDEAPFAICRATLSGQLLQINPAMLEILKYPLTGELLERDLPSVFVVPGHFEEIRETLVDAGALQGFESSWRAKDGREIQVCISGRAVRDDAGEVQYLDVVAENVTERKQLEAQLRQAQKMQAIGQLAGGIAHDFNNLLTIINGQAEVLMLRDLEPDVLVRLEEVKKAANRAATLTGQLLAFSRRQVLQSKVLDLNRVISDMSRMLRRLIGENIELRFNPAKRLGRIKADPHQIEQVLMNLVVNARDAMPRGGRLTIETSQVYFPARSPSDPAVMNPGEYALIAVTDTGHGMDQDTLARIFEPFFTTKKPGEGTGLGLSVVYGIVEQSGGDIRVESQVGRGSTFKIYLPCVDVLESTQPESAPKVSPRGSECILLVEDDQSVRDLVAAQLESLGYQILTAHDGSAALEMMNGHAGNVDLLLSDIIMPNLGGRELARELKKTRSNLKVMFVSGYPGHEVPEQDLQFPDAAFLAKPFSMEMLAKTVRHALDGVATNKAAAQLIDFP
jgi:two-component system cell cycle sensor histidine kinase/response regulator CckA